MKHGAPHEIFSVYSLCKTFSKLPSEIEKEDPIMIEALMQIEKSVQSKERNERSLNEFHNKTRGK